MSKSTMVLRPPVGGFGGGCNGGGSVDIIFDDDIFDSDAGIPSEDADPSDAPVPLSDACGGIVEVIIDVLT